MCGRFALAQPRFTRIEKELRATFDAVKPRYNIAPTQDIPVIHGEDGHYVMENMRWGLVPAWSKEPKTTYSTFNAKVETVNEKPLFKSAFRHRRCLIPASGFYEWKKEGNRKLPYYFTLASCEEMALAGLWEEWRGHDGALLHSATILVGQANPLVNGVHDRMACIVPPDAFEDWLNPKEKPDYLLSLVQNPFDAGLMKCWPVTPAVNSVKNDNPHLVEPIGQ
jgi:putative SOS response-associated peptidase YedK